MKENSIKLKIEELKKEGVYRKLSVSSSPNKAVITLNGKQVINLCSNNYLGFANHPRMKEAAKKQSTNTVLVQEQLERLVEILKSMKS